MKRDCLIHPKLLDLAARLGCSRPEAIGFLSLLWNWTADYAIAGDVGRWPNGTIARACDYTGDPEAFVNALVEAGWLDQDDQHRLVIHDWSQHCENWIRAKAQKAGIRLLGEKSDQLKSGTYERDLSPVLKSRSEPGGQSGTEVDLSPALKSGTSRAPVAQPSQAQPMPSPDQSAACAAKRGGTADQIAEVVDAWNAIEGVRRCMKVEGPRLKAIKARLAKPWWRDNWRDGIDRVARSLCCRGQKWKADFDWFVREQTLVKILEGSFDEVWQNGHHSNEPDFLATSRALMAGEGNHDAA